MIISTMMMMIVSVIMMRTSEMVTILMKWQKRVLFLSRESFEDDFEDIKDLISAKTLFAVDDAITQVGNGQDISY